MSQNFLSCDREQAFLLPPSVRDWLPEDHFAWLVLEAVDELDLSAFYGAYRQDGHGRAAHDPAMIVAVLLYAYATGRRSSRALERACVEDVAFRVLAGNQRPDHTTLARFRQRHQEALASVLAGTVELCAEAGLVRVGVIVVDGSKLAANARERRNMDYEQIARAVLEEAADIDAREDAQFGQARGDELPRELSSRDGRQAALAAARRRLEERRAEQARPIAKGRPERLVDAKRRLEEQHRIECAANEQYEASRASGRDRLGRRLSPACKPKALHAARAASGEGQHDRPGLAQREDRARNGYRATTRRSSPRSSRTSSPLMSPITPRTSGCWNR